MPPGMHPFQILSSLYSFFHSSGLEWRLTAQFLPFPFFIFASALLIMPSISAAALACMPSAWLSNMMGARGPERNDKWLDRVLAELAQDKKI
ncbi:hypothetical protein F9K96_16135 [Brucella anthropi]|uniref:hypothetical protein n=1 Tax=Brucella anthropi TaxID=529 RepID=UPI00124F5058|nr:hypothetical protein [Brucella anthropi]KAB2789782.1 hypothetical protein F9K96_16135 [Brucella anthropi]QOD66660.1 hypothetical protein HGK82_17430 [Ochrobactrum sp. MT180101]